jgi:hypothetical protein
MGVPQEELQSRGKHRQRHQHSGTDENRGPYPETKAAILGIMNGGVRRIKRDHCMSPETLSRICAIGHGGSFVRPFV